MESRLQLGVRAHDIGKLNVHELAHKIAQAGFTSVHLALHKAIEGFLPEPGHLSHQIAHEVHAAFTAKNLSLGVLGCYINPVHPDPAIRATELERFLEHITFARSFGATVVGTETGSKDPSCGYHEDTRSESTYTLFYRSLEKMLRHAEEHKIQVGIEPVARNHTIGSPELMNRLIKEMESSYLSVIYDPVNAFPAEGTFSQSDEISKCLDLFGDRICAFHLKDYSIVNDKKVGDLPCGTGDFNYVLLFSQVKKHFLSTPLLVENGTPASYPSIWEHLQKAWEIV